MAYITTEQVKVIRNDIKAAFPSKDGWKFSVRRDHHSSVYVSIMQYPKGYDFPEYEQVNEYYLDRDYEGKELKVLEKIKAIVSKEHWDKSDIMTDYFHCAFYYHIEIGRWNKPAIAKG